MGMTDDGMVLNDGRSGFTKETTESVGGSIPSGSMVIGAPLPSNVSLSDTESSEESLSHDLSDHSGFRNLGHFHHPLESRYSGTNSENLDGDT